MCAGGCDLWTILYYIVSVYLASLYHYIDGDEHLIIRVYDHSTCVRAAGDRTVLLSLHPALRYMIADPPRYICNVHRVPMLAQMVRPGGRGRA